MRKRTARGGGEGAVIVRYIAVATTEKITAFVVANFILAWDRADDEGIMFYPLEQVTRGNSMQVLLSNVLAVVVAPWQVGGFGFGVGRYGWAMALIHGGEVGYDNTIGGYYSNSTH
jgi:hypothetical protein